MGPRTKLLYTSPSSLLAVTADQSSCFAVIVVVEASSVFVFKNYK